MKMLDPFPGWQELPRDARVFLLAMYKLAEGKSEVPIHRDQLVAEVNRQLPCGCSMWQMSESQLESYREELVAKYGPASVN